MLILVGILVFGICFKKHFLKSDTLLRLILVFYLFLVVCIVYNLAYTGIGVTEIVRTARYNVFWLSVLAFRSATVEQLQRLLKMLFAVMIVICTIYLLQIFFDEKLLMGMEDVKTTKTFFGVTIPRYHIFPDLVFFFTFMALFLNPYRGLMRITSTVIFVAAFLGSFYRTFAIILLLCLLIALLLRCKKSVGIATLSVLALGALYFVIFFGQSFANSKTVLDIKKVVSGEVLDSDIAYDNMMGSSFTFRIAHFLERNQYVYEDRAARFLGVGLMTEDSKVTYNTFEFNVGLLEEMTSNINQIDTADISYSPLIMRYGYLGTLINLSLYAYLTIFFFKKRKNKYSFFSFLYMIFLWGISLSYVSLVWPIYFIIPLVSYCIVQKMEENA